MAKHTIHNLAAALVEKNEISKREAVSFISTVFDIVNGQISSGEVVKIKGLGTFKVIGVEARESVNVNTGERVYIESHAKLSFTPDTAMKELVNKPFSGFETVILNEGVEFDDMTEKPDEIEADTTVANEPAPIADEPTPIVEEPEPIADEPIAVIENPVSVAEESLLEEQVISEEPIPDEDAPIPDETTAITEPEQIVEMETEEVENKQKSKSWILWCLACAICFGCGYYVGKSNHVVFPENDEAIEVSDVVEESPDTLKEEGNAAETADTAKAAEIAKAVADTTKAEKEQLPPATTEEKEYLKYDAKDVRLRTGAYYIMGTSEVVKAREGETLSHLSRRILGDGMECYVEVYNDIKASTVLNAGQDVKIPELKLKKIVKKQNKQ